jgi:hypothetical protein
MARSVLGQIASALFAAGRASSDAHLAEAILTGDEKVVARSLKTRARNKGKTALWNIVTGKIK